MSAGQASRQQAQTPVATRDRLPALVRETCARFPWYAQLLHEGGLDESSPLEALPVIDERCLTEHYYTASHDHWPDAMEYRTSGTSSGRRKRVLYSPEDHRAYLDQRWELFRRFLADVPARTVAVADLGTGHAAASAREILTDLDFDARDIDFRSPIDEHVERLNQWAPTVLFTMPMILDRMLQTDRLAIRPRKLIVVGDVAPPNWRRHVAEQFGIGFDDVLDIVGSIEIGAIAYFCAETGLYHFHGHLLAEALPVSTVYPDSGVELPAESGILLLTSSSRSYFPALRFVTDDVVTGLRTLSWDGRDVTAFERIEGRFGGDLKHGERVSQHDLCAAVNHAFPGAPFEVVGDHGLEIRVVADAITSEQVAAVRAHLMDACPDVAQMVESGLVRDIEVIAIRPDELSAGNAKRQFNIGHALSRR